MATPLNEYGTPVVSYVSIADLRLGDNEWVNLDTHYFDRADGGTDWAWGCRPADGEIELRSTSTCLSDVLRACMDTTSRSEAVAVVMTRSNDEADRPGSLCAADVLKLIGSYLLHTQILNVIVDGDSHAAPRFVRWGPVPDKDGGNVPAVYIPLIPAPLFVESSEPLIANFVMTDWHDEPDQWHLWEVLYKSGPNFLLFQSELGYDDQVFCATSDTCIPPELLTYARSFSIPEEGHDRHPVDHWGALLLLDRGRELLP